MTLLAFHRRRLFALELCLIASIPNVLCQDQPDVLALGQLLKHPKKEERREAAYELMQLGDASAPAVRQLVRAMGDDDDQVWTRVVMSLAAIGPKAAYAIPALIDDMGGKGRYAEQHSQRCSFALSRIGAAAKPALVKALSDDNHHRRWGAVHALSLMGSEGAEHAAEVSALLADSNEAVRHAVSDALHVFGATSLPLLIEKLADGTEPEVQLAAIQALALFKKEANEARLPLLSLLGKRLSAETRGSALATLVALGMDEDLLAPLLIEAVLSKESALRDHAMQGILTMLHPAQHLVPTLSALLLDHSYDVRALAAATLSRLGSDAVPAAHVVMARLSEGGWEAAEVAWLTGALTTMGPSVIPAVLNQVRQIPLSELNPDHWAVQCLLAVGVYDADRVLGALDDESTSIRYVALEAFPDLRRRDARAQANLRRALQDEAGSLRAASRGALVLGHAPLALWSMAIDEGIKDSDARVRAATLACLPASPMSDRKRRRVVASLFHDPDQAVQREAIVEVGRLGPVAEKLVPDLVSVLEQTDNPHIDVALQALGNMESEAAPSVPVLASMLTNDAHQKHRLAILGTLRAIGGRAKEALPGIKSQLKMSSPEVKVAALEAFARVETDPGKLTPVFLKAIQDPLEDLRKPAIDGFSRLGKDAGGAVNALVAMLDDGATDGVALEALRQIRFRDVKIYIKLMEHKNSQVRSFSCERLGRLGNVAKEALPLLRKLAKDDDESYVRRLARDAVNRVEDRG